MDRVETRRDPVDHLESFAYDAEGHLIRHTDRRGKVTTYTYDPVGRQTFVGYGTTFPGGTPTYESTTSFSYDDGNRLLTTVDSVSGTITRT